MPFRLSALHMIQLCSKLFSPATCLYTRKQDGREYPVYYKADSTLICTPVTDLDQSDDSKFYTLSEMIKRAREAYSSESDIKILLFPIVQERLFASGLYAPISEWISQSKRNHWVTLHYDLETKKATLIDSCMRYFSAPYDFHAIREPLAEGLKILDLEVNNFEVFYQGVQIDRDSCGLWTCCNLEAIAKDKLSIMEHTSRLKILDVYDLMARIHILLGNRPNQASSSNLTLTSKQKSARTIQHFFTGYRQKQKIALQQAITTSPSAPLLQALNLRFQCMHAVAAAKFPVDRPIEDKVQANLVLESIQKIAQEKGIVNINAVTELFKQNIALAETIQSYYYHGIWKKSHPDTRNMRKLMNQSYFELCDIVARHSLPISCDVEKPISTLNLLALARDIIRHANDQIIDALLKPSTEMTHETLTITLDKMLATYMKPSDVSASKDRIDSVARHVLSASSGM